MQYSYLKHWKGALPDVDKGRNAGLSGRDHRAADRQQISGFPKKSNGLIVSYSPCFFNELRKNLEGISQKVLTDSLRSMEEDGIITRTVYPEVPPRVEYALSALGESMRPIMDAMEAWGNNYKNQG